MDTNVGSAAEQDLIQAVAEGRVLTCSNLDPSNLMHSTDKRHVIRAELIRDILLGRHVEHPDPHGLRLVGARITGTLDLDWLVAAIGLELSKCAMDEPMTMQGARLPWMTLDGTHLPALFADGVQTVGTLNLRGLRVETDSKTGAVRLIGAHIGGSLNCDGAVLTNKSGPALHADSMQADDEVVLSFGFRGEADTEIGAVRLFGAHIGGSLWCYDALLNNESGPALHADSLETGGAVLLNEGFRAQANSANGAVRLIGANIGVSVECIGAVLTNRSGPALILGQSVVNGSIFLTQDFRAAGRGKQAAVRIVSTKINGSLNCHNGHILNPDGPALELRSSSVSQLYLPGNAVSRSGAENDPQSWENDGELDLDGFIYSTLSPDGADLPRWLVWLRQQTPAYAAQPYQQLATIYRAMGDEAAARKVLIAQQDDLLARGKLGGRRVRAWHRFKRISVGYGYQSWRALVGLIVVMILALALGLAAGRISTSTGQYVATRTSEVGHPQTACSTIEQLGLGLEVALPAIHTGITNQCNFDTVSHIGQVLTALSWLLQVAAWAFATLVIAGYTGLIRKT